MSFRLYAAAAAASKGLCISNHNASPVPRRGGERLPPVADSLDGQERRPHIARRAPPSTGRFRERPANLNTLPSRSAVIDRAFELGFCADGNPRRLISCLLSKTSWPAQLNLYPHETKSACNEPLSGKLKRPPSNAFFKFDHISARRLLGPPATSPFSSRAAGGSTGLPPKFTCLNDAPV